MDLSAKRVPRGVKCTSSGDSGDLGRTHGHVLAGDASGPPPEHAVFLSRLDLHAADSLLQQNPGLVQQLALARALALRRQVTPERQFGQICGCRRIGRPAADRNGEPTAPRRRASRSPCGRPRTRRRPGCGRRAAGSACGRPHGGNQSGDGLGRGTQRQPHHDPGAEHDLGHRLGDDPKGHERRRTRMASTWSARRPGFAASGRSSTGSASGRGRTH